MKLNIIELRDMIAEAVRQTVREAKGKPKMIAARSEESIEAQRERQICGLPGYTNGNVLDMSKPLGKRNLLKRQGRANLGNWTSEGRISENMFTSKAMEIVKMMVSNGVDRTIAMKLAPQILQKMEYGMVDDPESQGMGDPSELGIEARHEAIRHLVRTIVAEEIRVIRGRR